MIIVCGWCMKNMGNKEPLTDQRVSHGICPECHEKLLIASGSPAGVKEELLWALDRELRNKATKTAPDT